MAGSTSTHIPGSVTTELASGQPALPPGREPHPQRQSRPNGAFEADNSQGNQLKEGDKGFRRTPHANYSLGDLRSDVGPWTGRPCASLH